MACTIRCVHPVLDLNLLGVRTGSHDGGAGRAAGDSVGVVGQRLRIPRKHTKKDVTWRERVTKHSEITDRAGFRLDSGVEPTENVTRAGGAGGYAAPVGAHETGARPREEEAARKKGGRRRERSANQLHLRAMIVRFIRIGIQY